jgi:hypothetical protein
MGLWERLPKFSIKEETPMWLLRTLQLFFLVMFVWFMVFDVFVPLLQRQPLFPTIRELFRKKEPAKADIQQPEEVKKEENTDE